MVGLWTAIASLTLSGVFQAGGEYFSKLWGLAPSSRLAAFAVACYAISSLVWLPALLYRNQLSTVGVAWDLIAICATLALGFFVFHETLSMRQSVGLVLALIALWLLLT